MELLFINNYHYLRGGAEQVFLNEIELLRKKGHNVNTFARKNPRDIPARYSNLFPENIKTDSLYISWEAVKTAKEVIYSKSAQKALEKLMEQIQPEIAHAHNIYGRLTTSILDLLYDNNIPTVITLHDYKLICPSYKLMHNNRICEDCKGGKFYNALLNRCHKNSLAASAIYAFESFFNQFFKKYKKNIRYFISPSLFLKNKFIEFGWGEKQIVHIPNYLVLSDFIPQYEPGDYFLYIGRLSAEKGIATLIQSFMRLNNKKAKLLIVGEGPESEKLKKMTGNNIQIKFTGYLSGKNLAYATQNALGVIVPSEWYENAPISILESFAYGKPVIGACIGGIPEMIDDNKNGFLFESGNSNDLEDKLDLLMSSSFKKVLEMGKAAREKVEKSYNEEFHYEKLISLYSAVLNR